MLCYAKSLQACPTLCDPHRRQPTRLPRPWDSPGKNAGVGCHFLLHYMKVKRESESESQVAQSCSTLSDMRYSIREKNSVVFPGGSAVKNPPAMQESQERQVPSLGHKDPREEGMATLQHFPSESPWREEPGGLQSIASAKSRAPLKQGSTQAHKEQCVCVYVCSVTQSCPTLSDPMDRSPPGSYLLENFQARILNWIVISYSRGSS